MARILQTWTPIGDGEFVCGTYLGVKGEFHVLHNCTDDKKRQFPMVVVRKCMVLDDQLDAAQVGRPVVVQFEGVAKSRRGYEYKSFRVVELTAEEVTNAR
jgi:hypothetical protein